MSIWRDPPSEEPYLKEEGVNLLKTLKPCEEIVQSLKRALQPTTTFSSTSSHSTISQSDYFKPGIYSRGLVSGCLYFCIHIDGNDMEFDCDYGLCPIYPPKEFHNATKLTSTAPFILVVEKTTNFHELTESDLIANFGCIIVLTRGVPDLATLFFLRKIKKHFKLPVLALVDRDPKGMKTLYTLNQHLDNEVKWLGIRLEDVEKYKLPRDLVLSKKCLKKKEIKMGNDLLKDETFLSNYPELADELREILQTSTKLKSEAPFFLGFHFLQRVYVPLKLQELYSD